MGKVRQFHGTPDVVVLHCVPASQYSTKVLAGLASRNIPHNIEFAAPQPRDRRLPTKRTFVPAIEYKRKAVDDSTEILRFLDQNVDLREGGEKFFPDSPQVAPEVERLNKEAEERLDAFCDYYNYVNKEGYERSVRKSLSSYIPWFAFWVDIDARLAGKRKACLEKCQKVFDKGTLELNDEDVRKEMHEELIGCLKELSACLKSPEQTYLCGTQLPSAADLAVYSKLCRLMDKHGDVSMGAALPDLLDESGLARLKIWFANMQTVCPLQWKGKRRR